MTTNFPRIGFHYFPDTAHYRQIDLDTWLPELQRLGASGVTLLAPPERAIPERFIAGLLSAGIQPTLHFPFHCRMPASPNDARPVGTAADRAVFPGCIPLPDACPPPDTLRLLLNAYARWGVRQVAFFDRPNLRGMWSPSAWLQGDLVERFLDLFLPAATLALEAGLSPIFPPLAPGGDYWDLSFLRSALRGLKRRCSGALLDRLILGAQAFPGTRPLDWGAGGPDRWRSARPYQTPQGEQDHLGFRIFEWYLAIARQELGAPLPVVLLRTGQRRTGTRAIPVESSGEPEPPAAPQPQEAASETANPAPPAGAQLAAGIAHARENIAIAELLAAAPEDGGLPAEVLAGHFWLLSADARTPAAAESWFPPAGRLLPVVSAFQSWAAHRLGLQPSAPSPVEEQPAPDPAASPASPAPTGTDEGEAGTAASYQPESAGGEHHPGKQEEDSQPAAEPGLNSNGAVPEMHSQAAADKPRAEAIDHYILLPLYAWGAADWDLALVQPLIQQGHPTIGFSLSEARLARRVTVVGGPGAVSSEALDMLRRNGCKVERLMEDGTLIASS